MTTKKPRTKRVAKDKASKAQEVTTSTATEANSDFEEVCLHFDAPATLMAFHVDRKPLPKDTPEEDARPTLGAQVRLFDQSSGLCVIRAGSKIGQEYIKTIHAEYVFVIRGKGIEGYDVKELSASLVKNVLWSKFRDMFAIVNSQAHFKLPDLPIILKKDQIRFLDDMEMEPVASEGAPKEAVTAEE